MVLDFGNVAERGADVTGVDISNTMIKLTEKNLKKAGLKARLLTKSVGEIDFPNDAFDLVTSITVLQHITDPNVFRKAVKNIVRVTKPGGQILLLEYAPERRKELTKVLLIKHTFICWDYENLFRFSA
ncbi:unnamed protein product [marine sediment metagenome]|uniref:Methyltransferase type 11 domain-containing protein n=1 Tax=marine sediment metagenome TaxID=412755 RepID=X1NTW4_9ZZZZ